MQKGFTPSWHHPCSTLCMPPSNSFYVYILRCSDCSLYVGHTSNLKNRLLWHRCGFASRHTAAHLPVRLVYSEKYEDEQTAIDREHHLKNWSRRKKEVLIDGDIATLRSLSKSRD
ncbi:MAG TPA: GIY-YIG nuclease family protein [Proteobacteria bacterium]|nr:GIY-YIG nuclease family protein [Pseudomonadota bacterium]